MSRKWSVPVSVIVMGTPEKWNAERLRSVRDFINRILANRNVPHYISVNDFELRDADGNFIDPGPKVKDAPAFQAGATFYLNPRAGVGA